MQRITKFSALIGFFAVMTFAIGLFMFAPSFTGHSFSMSIPAAHADWGTDTSGCCGSPSPSPSPTPTPPPPPPAAPYCYIYATPSSINVGEGVTISWATYNATSVYLDGVNVTGINSVVKYPTQNTTYTLLVSGLGGTNIPCSVPVVVVAPQLSCAMDATPTTITAGQSATLSWSIQNAVSASIDQGIGSVSLNVPGSRLVSPTQTTTYTLTASGNGKTVTCAKTITVVPVVQNDPSCTLDASASTITNGQAATLTWTTQNATAGVSLTDVGNNIAANSSVSVSPTYTKTYTLTASGNGKTVTCMKTITVTTVNNPNLACTMNASVTSFPQGGGTTQLSWTTTGAASASIDQGIGGVSLNDSKSVFVPDNRNYTLTAYDSQGRSVSCVVSTVVDHGGGGGGGGGGSSRPSCTLFHTSTHNVSAGQKATLSWTTIRGSEVSIVDNHDKEIFNTSNRDEVYAGSVDVAPTRDTIYTLTVSKQGKTDSCDVHVYADNGGTGVTVVRDRQPVTTITFRDVPYTGFDAGPILAGTFYALLAAWALVAAYVIVIQKGSVMGFSLATAGFASNARRAVAPVVARTATAVAPTNLPVASDEDEEEEEVVEEEEFGGEEESSLQNRAFAAGVILSQDALKAVVRAGSSLTERMTIMDAVLARAKESLPREDGWIALDRARISALFN